MKLLPVFIYLFSLIIIFNGALQNIGGSDIGWQLRDGQYITAHHRVASSNTFSYEMPRFNWISPDWGLNVLRFLLFTHFGFPGFSIIQGIIITLTIFIFARAFYLSFWELSFIAVLIPYLEDILLSHGFSGQSISFLGLAVLYFILTRYENGQRKLIFLLPPLFLIWANLHGEFFLGYMIFGLWSLIYIITRSFTNHRISIKSIINNSKYIIPIAIISFVVTLINPYGTRLYTGSILTLTGGSNQMAIVEWLPLDQFGADWWKLVGWGVIIFLSISIILKQKKFLQYLPYIGPVFVLYTMSYLSKRYAWPMYLISIPVCCPFFSFIKPRIKWLSFSISLTILLISYFYLTFKILPDRHLFTMSWNQYCTDRENCSPRAAEFFQHYITNHHIPPDKYLTVYDWGGWLIWNYPGIKPTIDGRMPLWRDSSGYSAFEKYYSYERNVSDIDKSPYNLVYMATTKPIYLRLKELASEKKWKLIYAEQITVIYERVKPI